MTDNDIIKALECLCGHTLGDCDKCPLYKHIDHDCVPDVIEPALSLINRQQAEIERLEGQANELVKHLCRNRLQSIPLPMPVAQWLREELTEYCHNRVMEEL